MKMPIPNRNRCLGLACVASLMLAALCAPSAAQEKPGGAAVDRFLLTKVRLLPKPGTADRLAGARITGSNEGPTNAFVTLAKIAQAPADDGWLELAVPGSRVYRFVKFESAKGQAVALAELEFHGPAGRLTGKPFGTSAAKDSPGNTFEKALDGDPKTWFEAPTDNSYVGLDLGQQVQAPRPGFAPDGGPYAQPQKVQIDTWPPGAIIRYTTDGSTPTANHGQIYRGPIAVAANTSIAAVAFQNGLADSNVAICSYLRGRAAAVGEV